MRLLIAIALVCLVTTVPKYDGVAQEPKKEKAPVVRVLQGWSLEKLGGEEEPDAIAALVDCYERAWGIERWPPVGVIYTSLDEVAKRYPDKEFLKKLDKEVDFSKNVLLRHAWQGGARRSYRVRGTKEGPILVLTNNMRRTMDLTPRSIELIIPADIYKRSAERDRSQDHLLR